MKREKLISCLCAATIAFLLGFGSTACMVTGLNLPADLWLLALGCGAGALVAAVCYGFRRGGLILGGIGIVYCLVCAFSFRFHSQLQAMGFSAFQYYNRAYGLPIPEWFDGQTSDSQLLPLLLMAGLVMTAAAWTVMRRRRSFLAIIAALLPLATCLVVTDTVPDTLPIFLLLVGLVLLMMSQSTRRQNQTQGNRLTVILALPVCAAVLGLFLLIPQGDYSAPEQFSSLQEILDWFALQIPVVDQTSQGELVISIGGSANQKVNLSQVGRRVQRNTPVMELQTEYTGILYLRGRDYDLYTGLGWEATRDRKEQHFGPDSIWLTEPQTASIRVLGLRGQYYLPCYPTEQQTLTGGMLPNPDFINSYSYSFSPLRSDWQTLWNTHQYVSSVDPNAPAPDSRYLELPEETLLQAQEILNGIFGTATPIQPRLDNLTIYPAYNDISKAAAICDYVQSSATYDLNPGRIPTSEEDFALWFLEDCDKGYCVHFATAATVLLRAAGIPARYVEGYMVQTTGGATTIVRDKTAHAWVEYYLNHIGWVILDPTPDAAEPEPTTEPTTVPTEPITAPTTEPTETGSQTTPTTSPTEQGLTSQPSESQGIGLPGDSTGSNNQRQLPPWFRTLLRIMIWFAGIVLLIAGQWLFRRYVKQKHLHQGKPNVQALRHYRESKRLARLCGLPLPDHLTALAEKAKFSQYALTREELGQFDAIILDYIQTLREKPWHYRLVCRLVFAAY